MLNVKDLDANERLLILKAVGDTATKMYKAESDIILKRILADGQYDSEHGLGSYWSRHNDAKTIQDMIIKLQSDIAKKQADLNELQKALDKNAIHTKESYTLVAKFTELAQDEADERLEDLINGLGNGWIKIAASKVQRQRK